MIDNSRKYSIIVPVYNAENTLKECIESILSQNYSNFELILVNDGSNDNSHLIIKEYATIDNRIKFLHKKNGGASSARNMGLMHAEGDYILFIDSDDVVSSSHLDAYNRSDADCIITGLSIHRQDGSLEENVPSAIRLSTKSQISNFVEVNSLETFFRGSVCKAYRADLINKYEIHFDSKLHWGEDFLFILQFLSIASTIESIGTSNYTYYSPSQDGKYPFDADEYIYASVQMLDALNKIGNCNKAKINVKLLNYQVFVSRLGFLSFVDRVIQTYKVFSHSPSDCLWPENLKVSIKRCLELLRITILAK